MYLMQLLGDGVGWEVICQMSESSEECPSHVYFIGIKIINTNSLYSHIRAFKVKLHDEHSIWLQLKSTTLSVLSTVYVVTM